MNKYLKEFIHRGLIFSGFGPIIIGIIYFILDSTIDDFYVSGSQILLAIVSTYVLAFVQAGATVFNQIEEWSVAKSTACHFSVLYIAYVLCYLINTWIPLKAEIIVLFTAIFVIGYFVIWISVVASIRLVSRKMNQRLNDIEKGF